MEDVLTDAQKLLADHKYEEAAHLCFAQAQATGDLSKAQALLARGVELLQAVPIAHRAKLLTWKHSPTRIFVADWRNPEPDPDTLDRVAYAEYMLEKCLEIEKSYPNCEITGSFDALLRAYWWNGEFFLRAHQHLEAARRKGKALKMLTEISLFKQKSFCSEFDDEYKSAWQALVPAEFTKVSEQYVLDLKALAQQKELSESCPKAVLTGMAFINDLDYWDSVAGTNQVDQELIAAEARHRLVSGKSKEEVKASLVERILHGADLKPFHTHYMEINEIDEEELYKDAKKQFLHNYSSLNPTAWEELINKWHRTLGKAQVPSYHELVIQKDDMRNVARHYLMRQILTTRLNNWEKFHQDRLDQLSLSLDEVRRMLARTEKQSRSEIEQLFGDLPDAEERLAAARRIEEKEAEFKKFNDWSVALNKKLQSLWRTHGSGLGGLHFLLSVDDDCIPHLEKISAADLFQMRPREEAERTLTERLEKIIDQLAKDPMIKEQGGGSAIWVQLAP